MRQYFCVRINSTLLCQLQILRLQGPYIYVNLGSVISLSEQILPSQVLCPMEEVT
jgi:hypothetical protein